MRMPYGVDVKSDRILTNSVIPGMGAGRGSGVSSASA